MLLLQSAFPVFLGSVFWICLCTFRFFCLVIPQIEFLGDSEDPHSTGSREEEEKIGDEHPKRVRRTLPAWGQKKNVREATTRAQLETKIEERIEADSVDVKPVVAQTNLHQLTDSWAIARNTHAFRNKGITSGSLWYLN